MFALSINNQLIMCISKRHIRPKVIKKMTLIIKRKEITDVQGTLLDVKNVPVGESRLIKSREIKGNSVKSAVRELNRKGYSFEVTEDGLIDEVRVTRKA